MTRWTWTVSGNQRPSRPGAMVHAFDDTGDVEAECSGEALELLVQHGPFWDMLDQDESVTITLTPAVDQ